MTLYGGHLQVGWSVHFLCVSDTTIKDDDENDYQNNDDEGIN